MEQLWGGRKPKNSEKNLLQCQFVHHELNFKSPGIVRESRDNIIVEIQTWWSAVVCFRVTRGVLQFAVQAAVTDLPVCLSSFSYLPVCSFLLLLLLLRFIKNLNKNKYLLGDE
jgi:hypothetical protein